MADDPSGDALRQMAEHRGLKLLRSRRRKPGVGDYGMFGLTDAAGKPLLGVGDNGLTATAQEIETWLRSGALGTWQESAKAVPDQPEPGSKPRSPAPVADDDRIKPPARRRAAPPVPLPPTAPAAKVEPPPAPELVIRPAKASDAELIARLLNNLKGVAIDGETARRNLLAGQNAGGGLLLAELGQPIGCCGWAVLPTVQHGQIGRITVLFVDADHRRRGVATRLIAAAEQALAERGCGRVEVMSDIQIDNAHGFFRSLKFEQASYRFTRQLVADA